MHGFKIGYINGHLNVSGKTLHIGSRGWLHPHWSSTFYPDDLPDEWRFLYYSNEFNCVLLPSEYWLNTEPADVAQWIGDCNDDFVFYVEIDLDGDVARQLSLISILLPQLSAVVIQAKAQPWPEQASQPCVESLSQLMLEIVRTVGDRVALYCDDSCWVEANQLPNLGRVLMLAESENNEKSTDKIVAPGQIGGNCIALLASNEALTIMQIKSHVAALIRADSGCVCQALFVAGDCPNLDQLQQTIQLYALMA